MVGRCYVGAFRWRSTKTSESGRSMQRGEPGAWSPAEQAAYRRVACEDVKHL